MATIGFFPLNEVSHINATFGLAKRLQRRGHQVRYLAPLDFEERIRSQGLEFRPYFPELLPKGWLEQPQAARKETERKIFEMLCRGDFDASLRAAGFDLLIVDTYAPAPALVAYKLDIPVSFLSPTLPTQRHSWLPPATLAVIPDSLFAKWKIRLWWLLYDIHRRRRLFSGEPYYIQSLKKLALSTNYPLDSLDTRGQLPVFKRIPELVLCPRQFDFPQEKCDERLRYLGAMVDPDRIENIAFPWERINGEQRLIYCSLGTLTHRFDKVKELLEIIIDAVAPRRDWQLVISIGKQLKIEEFRPVPPNVVLVNVAPQLEILQRASIFITHGGLNSIKESILASVPMIVIPWAKPRNAIRVAYHGLGLMEAVSASSAERIRGLIETIENDPSFTERLAWMRAEFLKIENSDTGVETVEALLETPAQRST